MANVLHKTRDPTDYRVSVNTPDFPVVDWFINPDVSAVAVISRRYWKRPLADPVLEMTQAEKDAVDAAQTASDTAADRVTNKGHLDVRVAKAFAKLLLDEINILRAQHALAPRTVAQLRTVLENEIDVN